MGLCVVQTKSEFVVEGIKRKRLAGFKRTKILNIHMEFGKTVAVFRESELSPAIFCDQKNLATTERRDEGCAVR